MLSPLARGFLQRDFDFNGCLQVVQAGATGIRHGNAIMCFANYCHAAGVLEESLCPLAVTLQTKCARCVAVCSAFCGIVARGTLDLNVQLKHKFLNPRVENYYSI